MEGNARASRRGKREKREDEKSSKKVKLELQRKFVDGNFSRRLLTLSSLFSSSSTLSGSHPPPALLSSRERLFSLLPSLLSRDQDGTPGRRKCGVALARTVEKAKKERTEWNAPDERERESWPIWCDPPPPLVSHVHVFSYAFATSSGLIRSVQRAWDSALIEIEPLSPLPETTFDKKN